MRINKGLSESMSGKKSDALKTFETASKIAYKKKDLILYLQALFFAAQICEELNEPKKALELYENALKDDFAKKLSQLWYESGCLYSDLGENSTAISYLEKAISCESVWPNAYYKLSMLVSDEALKKELFQKYVEAEKDFEHSEKNPNNFYYE